MCRILSVTDNKIRELRIENAEATEEAFNGLTAEIFDEMSLLDASHCCNVFRGLQALELTAAAEDCWSTSQLADFLSYATGLEDLSINGCGFSLLHAEPFLSSLTWCSLAALSLTRTTLSEEKLLAFLRRHAATLKNLSLLDVDLRTGSWKVVLRQINSLLSLRTIHVPISD